MKLNQTTAESYNLITAYGEGYIEINRQRHQNSLIVMPEAIIENWHAGKFTDLNNASFLEIIKLKPELVLLGTGSTHQFLHPEHYMALTKNGIALECMSSAAACRTYNILMSEGRHIAAALIA